MKTELRADCNRCAALCCVLLAVDKGPKFGIDKPAGQPCPHLSAHRCRIHNGLTSKGFSGCVQFDCHGAGQIVVQEIFGGTSWQNRPELIGPMADAFRILREVQDLRLQLEVARKLATTPQIAALCDSLEAKLTPDWSSESLAKFDLAAARDQHAALLTLLRDSLTAPPSSSASAPAP